MQLKAVCLRHTFVSLDVANGGVVRIEVSHLFNSRHIAMHIVYGTLFQKAECCARRDVGLPRVVLRLDPLTAGKHEEPQEH